MELNQLLIQKITVTPTAERDIAAILESQEQENESCECFGTLF